MPSGVGTVFFASAQASPHGDALCGELTKVVNQRFPDALRVVPWSEMAEPGSVTGQLVETIRDARVVVADISNSNVNVYYEVGLAHAFGTPVVLLIQEGERPAFDLRERRRIPFSTKNWSALRAELTPALEAVVSGPARRPRSGPRDEDWMARAALQGLLVRATSELLEAGLRVFDPRHGAGVVVHVERQGPGGTVVGVRFAERTVSRLVDDVGDLTLFLLPR